MITLRGFLLNQYKLQKKNNTDISNIDCFGRFGYLCRTKFNLESALDGLNSAKLKRTKVTEEVLRMAYDDIDIIEALVSNRSVRSIFSNYSIKGSDVVSIINSYADIYKEDNAYYLADFYFRRNMYIYKKAYYFIRYNSYKDSLYIVRDEDRSPKNKNKRKYAMDLNM